MVTKRRHFTADCAQHPKLCRLILIDGLHQRTHGKITAIDNERVRILRFLLINHCLDPCKSAHLCGFSVNHRGKTVQMGVGVVREHHIQCLPGRLRSRSYLCAAGKQRHGQNCRKQPRQNSSFVFHAKTLLNCEIYSPFILIGPLRSRSALKIGLFYHEMRSDAM